MAKLKSESESTPAISDIIGNTGSARYERITLGDQLFQARVQIERKRSQLNRFLL